MEDRKEQIDYEELVDSLIQHTKNGEIDWERIRGKELVSGWILGKCVRVYDDKPDVISVNEYKFTSDNARDLYRVVQDYLRSESFDEWSNHVVNGIRFEMEEE